MIERPSHVLNDRLALLQETVSPSLVAVVDDVQQDNMSLIVGEIYIFLPNALGC